MDDSKRAMDGIEYRHSKELLDKIRSADSLHQANMRRTQCLKRRDKEMPVAPPKMRPARCRESESMHRRQDPAARR
jgi:hypothetical protein